MREIREILKSDEKSKICNDILRALPEWFGIETAIIDYVKQVQDMPFYAAFNNEKAVGFAALKFHNIYTAEICVMGVLKEYHRLGIGRLLIEKCERFCLDNGVEYITVKTLDESVEDEGYNKTRKFYLSMGFRPLEVFPLLWDEANPCLFMVKYVSTVPTGNSTIDMIYKLQIALDGMAEALENPTEEEIQSWIDEVCSL